MFGNLFARKRRLLANINGTQKAFSNGPNRFLVQLEQDLIKEYADIRLQEEEYWALKSRINWAAYGDRNTSFFHVSTLVRRHRNRIKSIKNSLGEWVIEEEEVKNVILTGYIDLFQTSFLSSNRFSDIENLSCCFLSEGDRDSLCVPVSEEKTKFGLLSLRPFKALGADGLHAGFFQYF
nr:uncharacterized protein LOC111997275 [Quercus suber]